MINKKKRLCIIAADAITFNAFLVNHLRALNRFYEVTLVCSNPGSLQVDTFHDVKRITIHRQVNIYQDIKCLLYMFCFFKGRNFDAVWSISPKAGLVTMLAAYLADVSIRVHCFTGQVWANKFGLKRAIFKYIDKLTLYLSSNPLCDSASQKSFLKTENFNVSNMAVIANGSISGVDTARFQPSITNREEIRAELALDKDAFLIAFIGRLNKDKGIFDLLRLMELLSHKYEFEMLLVGPDEVGIQEIIETQIEEVQRRCHIIGMSDRPEKYLQAADVFCLPSYREGFGTSIIEASSVGLPVLCYEIYGVLDAVSESKTGFLVPVGDVRALMEKVELLHSNLDLRYQLGLNGRRVAIEKFSKEVSTNFILDFFQEALAEKG